MAHNNFHDLSLMFLNVNDLTFKPRTPPDPEGPYNLNMESLLD